MSAYHGNSPGLSGAGAFVPGDLEAIAAVDGLGSLSLDEADGLDLAAVARLEAAAGAMFTAFAHERSQAASMPDGMAERLEGSAQSVLRFTDPSPSSAASQGPVVPPARPFSAVAAIAGWATAAALLAGLLGALSEVSTLRSGGSSLSPERRVAQFEMTTPDMQLLPWLPLGGDSKVKGRVVWSNERNEGFMRIQGLPKNDPSKSQYQLWIFRGTDPGAEPHPVDGGVFNVAGTGEVVIPIDAKLQVGRAGTFAVTVEKPGGVVVSGREQIVALAQRAS